MSNLFIELYSEEIPYYFFDKIKPDIKKIITEHFLELGLIEKNNINSISVYTTPCRIIIYCDKLLTNINIKYREICGPKVKATTEEKKGFLSAYNLKSIDELVEKDGNLVLIQENLQIKVKDVLEKNMENILSSIASSFPQNISWINSMNTRWISPLRNILCLFDNDILKFNFCDLTSNNHTYGHKILIGLDKKVKIESFDDYQIKMKDNFVIFNQNEREKIIVDKILKIEDELKLNIYNDDNFTKNLVKKIVDTMEYPDVFYVKFNKEFLKLPEMIITTAICNDYNCFCLKDNIQNTISNKIISFTNTKINENIVKELESAIDKKLSLINSKLAEYLSESLEVKINKLKQLPYHKGFGSVFNKMERLTELSKFICLWIPHCDLLNTEEAAKLCKIDCTTTLTKDNPILKGYLSAYYAEVNSYPKVLCDGIKQYYEPRNLKDPIPSTDIGKIISLAGRIDNITKLFITNEQSTSSKDPYGIRKNMASVIKILAEGEISIPFQVLVHKSISLFKTGIYKNNNESKISIKQKINKIKEDITNLCRDRFFSFLKDCGYDEKIIALVFDKKNKQNKPALNVYNIYKKIVIVDNYAKENPEKMVLIKNSYKRIKNILADSKIEKKIPLFTKIIRKLSKKTRNDHILITKISDLRIDMKREIKLHNYSLCLDLLYEFSNVLSRYFETNIIMSKNIAEKNAKLYLMYKTKNIYESLLYF
ncbi:MAG TPA: glycine--tRNA ligase subunit beta [Rickettsiales bacterium]|nr:glycine--tRNA ligase subunit beta [Rickettsiales bacterium]